jgi:hypothetical protein
MDHSARMPLTFERSSARPPLAAVLGYATRIFRFLSGNAYPWFIRFCHLQRNDFVLNSVDLWGTKKPPSHQSSKACQDWLPNRIYRYFPSNSIDPSVRILVLSLSKSIERLSRQTERHSSSEKTRPLSLHPAWRVN